MDKVNINKLQYETFYDLQKDYYNFNVRMYSLLVVAIGWFLAKDNPFPILETGMYANAAVAWLILVAIAFVANSRYYYLNNRQLYLDLIQTKEFPETLLSVHRITFAQVLLTLFLKAVFLIALGLMIWDRYVVAVLP